MVNFSGGGCGDGVTTVAYLRFTKYCQSVDNSSSGFMLKKYCVLSLIGVYVFSVDAAAASYLRFN